MGAYSELDKLTRKNKREARKERLSEYIHKIDKKINEFKEHLDEKKRLATTKKELEYIANQFGNLSKQAKNNGDIRASLLFNSDKDYYGRLIVYNDNGNLIGYCEDNQKDCKLLSGKNIDNQQYYYNNPLLTMSYVTDREGEVSLDITQLTQIDNKPEFGNDPAKWSNFINFEYYNLDRFGKIKSDSHQYPSKAYLGNSKLIKHNSIIDIIKNAENENVQTNDNGQINLMSDYNSLIGIESPEA